MHDVPHTIDARRTRRVDDPPKLLVAEMRPGSLGTGISTLQVYRNDLIKLGVRHVLEPIPHATRGHTHESPQPKPRTNAPLVPQDTRIVHEDGDPPKSIDGALYDSRTVYHRSRVHDGVAAGWQRRNRSAPEPKRHRQQARMDRTNEPPTSFDLIDDLLRCFSVEIVHDDVGAARSKQE